MRRVLLWPCLTIITKMTEKQWVLEEYKVAGYCDNKIKFQHASFLGAVENFLKAWYDTIVG
jgi:hypothetical protein